jgi:sugar lactone lactonase YvrE
VTWEVAVPGAAELGERPVWDDAAGALIWVDIRAGRVHRHRPCGSDDHFDAGPTVGAAGLRAGGGYVLAAGTEFVLTGPDGAAETRIAVPGDGVFNDAAVGPGGRLWAGTATPDLTPGAGALYRLDPDLSFHLMLDGVTESNGLAWSADGTTMYYVDSGERRPRIRAFAHDPASGALGAPRDFAVFGEGDGVPDGLVVDAQECVWVALWEGGAVRRYAPDGSLLAHLPVPARLVTCPGFGGPGLADLYVTTAWEGMTAAARAADPLAGHVLRCRPGATGSAAVRFAA